MKNPIDSADSQEKIFKIALPVSLEAVFQASLGFIDQIIVGTLGATAVAAVGLCNSISFIVMLLYSCLRITPFQATLEIADRFGDEPKPRPSG